MSIKLHKECKKRLIQKIAEQLPSITVRNKLFIDPKSALLFQLAESVPPERGKIKEELEKYISESPVSNFLYEYLSEKLYENQKYDSELSETKLVDLDGYQEPVKIAHRLINALESLPWEYMLTIKFENEFSKLFSKNFSEYKLSDSLKIISPDDNFSKTFPLKSGVEARDRFVSGSSLLDILQTPEWDKNAAYLQITTKGFIGPYGVTRPLDDAISTLKKFCGLGIALRLFGVNYRYKNTPFRAKFLIHQKDGESWVIKHLYELDSSISETLVDLIIPSLNGKLDTQSEKVNWIKYILPSIKTVFSNPEKAKRILLGAQWLFDSYCGRNELLSFIQVIIVLEILLGGVKTNSHGIGLGKLLGNRCAYLIGSNDEQRKELIEDFEKSYDIRSKIVHQGRNWLSLHERALFSKLQWMCCRVIQEEVKLLEKNLKNDA